MVIQITKNTLEDNGDQCIWGSEDLWLCNALSPKILELWLKYMSHIYKNKVLYTGLSIVVKYSGWNCISNLFLVNFWVGLASYLSWLECHYFHLVLFLLHRNCQLCHFLLFNHSMTNWWECLCQEIYLPIDVLSDINKTYFPLLYLEANTYRASSYFPLSSKWDIFVYHNKAKRKPPFTDLCFTRLTLSEARYLFSKILETIGNFHFNFLKGYPVSFISLKGQVLKCKYSLELILQR